MRVVKRLISIGLGAAVLCLIAIHAGAFLTKPCSDLILQTQADVAVILGGGMDPDGTLHTSTMDRVEAGVALLNSNSTKRLHMTGGRAEPGGPAAGAQMSLYAQSLGTSQSLILQTEDASQSTLQNALFSKPILQDAETIILVSEGFHLTRGWLSFRWAGLPVTHMCHSTPFRVPSMIGATSSGMMLIREVVAYPFNLARALTWSMLNAIGQDRKKIDGLLH